MQDHLNHPLVAFGKGACGVERETTCLLLLYQNKQNEAYYTNKRFKGEKILNISHNFVHTSPIEQEQYKKKYLPIHEILFFSK